MDLKIHTRHIPFEHLDFSCQTAYTVKNNGLCDVLQNENQDILKDNKVSIIETRLAWFELDDNNSKKWERFEKAISDIEKNGFQVGVFCWFQYPPKDFNITKLKCCEHNTELTIASLWDPKLIEQYDKLYKELYEKFNNKIKFIYIGVYGDYGEVCFPSGVKHYIFSPKEGHPCYYCNDFYAKKSFANYLQTKYKSLFKINKIWGTNYKSWDCDFIPKFPIENNNTQIQIDFADWYTNSITEFCEKVCFTVNKYFPKTKKGLPIGFPDEKLCIGQIKSKIIKIASKYSCIVRWTGLAFLQDFGKSDVLAKRVSSSALYYNVEFGTEAALTLDNKNTANAMYENIANASTLLHNDIGNFKRDNKTYSLLLKDYKISKPNYNIGIYYPVEGEMLNKISITPDNLYLQYEELLYDITNGTIEKSFKNSFDLPRDNKNILDLSLNPIDVYILRAASLRHYFDYFLADSTLIFDGSLKKIKYLFFIVSSPIPLKICKIINSWIKQGGKVFIRKGVQLSILENEKKYTPKSIIFTEPPQIEPYETLRNMYGKNKYYTVHDDFISSYDSEINEIKYYNTPKL